MSTTTQILFNSPALHSLKRDQLVKLCKTHALKASGKNRELIERLQLHAKTLPPDDPLSIATRMDNSDAKPAADSEDESSVHSTVSTPDHTSINITRPSEQWEVVMDTITEVDEETLRSNRGGSDRHVGEFGTNASKGSVTSSLRAIANSLGLKSKACETTSSTSSLSSKEVVQSSSTLPTSEPNGVPEEPLIEPVPGQSNLQGFPAPSGARLSLTQAPTTTTIRLVSNPATGPELLLSPPKLKPFTTTFDLVPGTPGGAGKSSVSIWPLSPGGVARESLYPPIPIEELANLNKQWSPRSTRYDNSDMDIDVPGDLVVSSVSEPMQAKAHTSARFNTGATPKSNKKPSVGLVDIFSPAPKPQHASTRTKLGVPRSEPFVFGSPLPQNSMSNLEFRTAAQSVLDEMNKRLATEGVEAVDANVLDNRRTSTEEPTEKQDSNDRPRIGDMFEKIHQKEFDKMDSITSHYAAKRAQSTATQPILSKKRKSSLAVKERKPGAPVARHRPNGSRIATGASAKILPGGFDEESDEDDEVADRRMSKRPRVEGEESGVPVQPEKPSLAPLPDPEEEVQKQKERDAIRRRLEHNKAKRRSSMGRPSLGRAPPPQPSRFGFLASARSLVQNVWNRGAGSKAPSNLPVAKPAQPKQGAKSKATDVKKSAVHGSSGAPPPDSPTKRIPSGSSSNSVRSNGTGRSTLAPPVVSGADGEDSCIGKSSTLSLNPPGLSVAANPRSSTVAGYSQSKSKIGSLVGFSSLGRRIGLSANNSQVSSMGTKSNIRAAPANVQNQTTAEPRTRATSTLMAPTASSLAKTIHGRNLVSAVVPGENATLTRAGTSAKPQFVTSPQTGVTLEQITNSPQSPAGKVFGQPLSPSPARPPMSLTTTATRIVGQATAEGKSPSLAKMGGAAQPKTLPGRRPRISRSKVIARLASQRAAGTDSGSGPSTGTGNGNGAGARGKVRSSTSADVAGKTRQSYAGTRGADLLMSAKKRVRQSEQARRRSRAATDSRMDID